MLFLFVGLRGGTSWTNWRCIEWFIEWYIEPPKERSLFQVQGSCADVPVYVKDKTEGQILICLIDDVPERGRCGQASTGDFQQKSVPWRTPPEGRPARRDPLSQSGRSAAVEGGTGSWT